MLLRTRLGVKFIGKTLAFDLKSIVGLLTYTWVHMKASNTIELAYHVDIQVESFFSVERSHHWFVELHIDGLMQDYSNSSVLAMELLQSFAKPSICIWNIPSLSFTYVC